MHVGYILANFIISDHVDAHDLDLYNANLILYYCPEIKINQQLIYNYLRQYQLIFYLNIRQKYARIQYLG